MSFLVFSRCRAILIKMQLRSVENFLKRYQKLTEKRSWMLYWWTLLLERTRKYNTRIFKQNPSHQLVSYLRYACQNMKKLHFPLIISSVLKYFQDHKERIEILNPADSVERHRSEFIFPDWSSLAVLDKPRVICLQIMFTNTVHHVRGRKGLVV